MKSLKILSNIEGIAILRLTSADVVRERLVKEIIDAYEKDAGNLKEKIGLEIKFYGI